MYIYHNTDIEYFIDILYDGTLRPGKDTKISNQNIHEKLQKYIYFHIMKKKGVLGKINPYFFSQFRHELFIEKPLSLSKAKYILLPENIDYFLGRVIKYKITETYPHIKIIYVSTYDNIDT